MPETMTAAELADRLGAKILGARAVVLQREIQHYFPARNNASFLPECTRQMEYARLAPEARQLWDPEFQARLNDGKEDERRWTRDLLDLGFNVVSGQERFELKDQNLSGKIEGKIEHEGRKIPFEVKSVNQYDYQALNTVEDLQRKHRTRRAYRQCQAYLWGFSEEVMLLFLTDGHGHWKYLVIEIDAAVGEDIFSRCETVQGTVVRNTGIRDVGDMTLSPRIPYTHEICGSCPFRATCLPDAGFGQGAVIADEELAEKVARYHRLSAASKERELLGKEIKAQVEGKEMVMAGEYAITGRWVEVKGNPNPKPKAAYRYWDWEAELLKGSP